MNSLNRLLFPLAGLLWACLAGTALAAPLISEFMADNENGLTDSDGDFSDWIELINPDAVPLTLDGYSLTDDADQLDKWRFPAVTLAPGQTLVVFASGKDRAVTGAPLHTNFKLAGDGELLALIAPDGQTVVHSFGPVYPRQFPNMSYGLRASAADGESGYFQPATPNAPNGTSFVFPLPPVQFSATSQLFATSITLALTGPSDPDLTIRYTTDRKVPTAASTAYTAPIEITATTQIRARLFRADGAIGATATHTFIKADANALAFSSNLPLMVFETFGQSMSSDTQREMVWFIFEPKIDPEHPEAPPLAMLSRMPDFVERGGAEVRGSSTAGDPKFQFTAEIRDEENLDKSAKPLGMPAESDWILSSPYNFDRAFVRNPFIFDLSREIGPYAPRNKFCEIFFDLDAGKVLLGLPSRTDYRGVYSLTEKIKRSRNRVDVAALTSADKTAPNVTGGYIFKVDRLDPGDTGVSAGGQSLGLVYPKERVAVTNPPNPDPPYIANTEQKTYLKDEINRFKAAVDRSTAGFTHPTTGLRYDQYIDVPLWIDHWWLNNLMMNVDALRLSAYYHKNRLGKLVAGPIWDFDRAAGSTDGRDSNPKTWNGGGDATNFWTYPWWQQCFKDPDYYQKTLDRWFELRRGPFSKRHMKTLINDLAAPLGEAAVRNFTRWPEVAPRSTGLPASPAPTVLAKWRNEVRILQDWLSNRVDFIDSQFPPLPSFSPDGGTVAPGFGLQISAPSSVIRYTLDGSDPRAPGGGVSASGLEFPGGLVIHRPILQNSVARYRVPADDALGTTWRTGGFDDSGWASGRMGLGFEVLNAQGQKTGGLWAAPINTDVETVMKNINPTLYVRLPFRFDGDPARVSRINLRVKYDDGYVVWLNGTEIKAAAKPAVLAWNSASATKRPSDVVTFDVTNATALAQPVLVAGDNLLAVQMMNGDIADPDALLAVEVDILENTPLGSVPITQSTLVTARSYNPIAAPITTPAANVNPYPSFWGAPVRKLILVGEDRAAGDTLAISEVMYHPMDPTPGEEAAGLADQDSFEFIELMNISPDRTVSLYESAFVHGVDHALNSLGRPISLAPGQRGVVVANRRAFALRYGPGALILGEYKGDHLDNSGERLTLNGWDGFAIRDFVFDDAAPWPVAADGSGTSMVLKDPASNPDHAVAANWMASRFPLGSPGQGELTYADWRATGGADGAAEADDDGDGETNFQEYAAGTDARKATSQLLTSGYSATAEGGQLVLRVPINREAGDLRHTVEYSADLVAWAPAGAAVEMVGEERGKGPATLVVYRTTAAAGASGFLRVRYASAP